MHDKVPGGDCVFGEIDGVPIYQRTVGMVDGLPAIVPLALGQGTMLYSPVASLFKMGDWVTHKPGDSEGLPVFIPGLGWVRAPIKQAALKYEPSTGEYETWAVLTNAGQLIPFKESMLLG